jgi:protein ImuB
VALGGGRGFLERQTLIPWGDRPVPKYPADAPWPGVAISARPELWPMPVPATVYPEPLPAEVFDAAGRLVSVSARMVLSGAPAQFRIVADSKEFQAVSGWAGPWPVDERWWDPAATSRQARFQFVGGDGRAWLFTLRQARWSVEAAYD